MAFYLLKRIADIIQGKAIVLTDTINISPKSYMINFPLISKADTVLCKGEGKGFDDVKLSLWSYLIPPSWISPSNNWSHKDDGKMQSGLPTPIAFFIFLTGFQL